MTILVQEAKAQCTVEGGVLCCNPQIIIVKSKLSVEIVLSIILRDLLSEINYRTRLIISKLESLKLNEERTMS
jgi:hypothetical protein